MRVVFLGSGAFAVPSLSALVGAGHEVLAVVTQPDRESGRGRHLTPPPTKPVAEAHGLMVLQPRRVRAPESQELLRRLAPEIQVVVAYGQILPADVIGIAPLGTVNVHASLLPRYRGAAPIQWAIARGEAESGVTTMLIDEGLDTGPILLARPTTIKPDETAAELAPRLAAMGADLLLETLAGLAEGRIEPVPQDNTRATLAPLLTKEDGRIDWSRPALEIANRIRGFQPWPGSLASLGGRGLKVLRARVAEPAATDLAPGTIGGVGAEGVQVGCGSGSLLYLIEVQPESRRPMTAGAFAAGAHLVPGSRFD